MEFILTEAISTAYILAQTDRSGSQVTGPDAEANAGTNADGSDGDITRVSEDLSKRHVSWADAEARDRDAGGGDCGVRFEDGDEDP